MKITSAQIFHMRIPFVQPFSHSLKKREFSDSIIVKLISDEGVIGYGEGVPRPYVTGERIEQCIPYIKNSIIPVLKTIDFPDITSGLWPHQELSRIHDCLPDKNSTNIIAWNASHCAVELALLDCLLRKHNLSLNHILPAKAKHITYSAIISADSIEKITSLSRRIRSIGFVCVKIKIGTKNDYDRIAAVRKILGPSMSIRLDANGAFTIKNIMPFLASVKKFNIDSIEQPIPRGNISDFLFIKKNSPIPVMIDESLVTVNDAKQFIAYKACDFFNLRISKCGGISNTLIIAEMAKKAGIKTQLGCQVGETGILSAAGRQVAAYLNNLSFIEGSYSTLLLSEDITRQKTVFGNRGEAPLLKGAGLGITIDEDRIKKYAKEEIRI